jgi:hypothetical protein
MRAVHRPSGSAPAASAHALARAIGGAVEETGPGMTSITFPPPAPASTSGPSAATIAASPASSAPFAPSAPYVPFDTTPRTISRAVEIDELDIPAATSSPSANGSSSDYDGGSSRGAAPAPAAPPKVDKQEIYEYVVDRLRRDALIERELLSKTIQDLY